MPNFALHVLMASRVAEEWRARPCHAPFDPAVRANMNAFLHGCVGPDMGMYPGGDPLISALVHRVRTGRLTRALLDGARTAPERAFAWGWLTHLLADVMVHPLVNAAAARSVGRREVLSDELEAIAHVRIEMGLDAAYTACHADLLSVRLTPAFDSRVISWFRRALRETYGAVFDHDDVERSHRAVVRFHRPVLGLACFAARRWRPRPRAGADLIVMAPLIATLRWVMLRMRARSELAALLDPLPPTPSLRAGVDRFLHVMPRLVRGHEATALASLPDHDLETGALENPWQPTHATLATLHALAGRGLVVDGHPALAEAA